MWQRRWVTVHFIIDNWLYSGRLFCSVNLNEYDEFLDPNYCEDIEYLEDVELIGIGTYSKISDDDKPKDESEITLEDVYNCSNIELFI